MTNYLKYCVFSQIISKISFNEQMLILATNLITRLYFCSFDYGYKFKDGTVLFQALLRLYFLLFCGYKLKKKTVLLFIWLWLQI